VFRESSKRIENPGLLKLPLTCIVNRKKMIRLGKQDKKDKETEVTWFCSWLSDTQQMGLA
jgi:hypothetical protein